jgi:hypothetical protein
VLSQFRLSNSGSQLLYELEVGTKIAKSLSGRSAESPKNRFYGTIHKRLSAEVLELLTLRVRNGNFDALRSVSPTKCVSDTIRGAVIGIGL